MGTPVDTRFDLDADIGVSEIRSEERLEQALRKHPALRLCRRSDVLAVLVSPSRWREITDVLAQQQRVIDELREALEQHENDAVDEIIAERAAAAQLHPLTDESWAEIVKRFGKLTSE